MKSNTKQNNCIYSMLKLAWLIVVSVVCLCCAHVTIAQSLFNTDLPDIDLNLDHDPTVSLNTTDNKNTNNDSVSLSIFGSSELDSSFTGSGEIWINKWGISTELLDNNASSSFFPADSEYFNLDVKRRFGSKNKSNFELGLGWQELNIDSQLDASGPRVSFGGNLKFLKSFSLYGNTSYFPDLDENISKSEDVSAYEFEAGLSYKPLPSLSLKAGYRVFNLDLEDPIIEDLGSNSGFLLGSDWSW